MRYNTYVILKIKTKILSFFQVFTDYARNVGKYLKFNSKENEHIEPKAFMVVMPSTAFKTQAYLT